MKHTVHHCIFAFFSSFILAVNLVICQQNELVAAIQVEDPCPLWYYFSTTTKQCECYTNPITDGIVKCGEHEVQLRLSYCMTYEEEGGLYLAHCHYFQGDAHSYEITESGNFIILPKNASELNDYMCGPMNRKGRLCSECIDGFGPSFTSLGSVCSNCTDAWYGVPLYLFLEFVPLTVFYAIILMFKINATSAPMVAFVFFSQLEVASFVFHGNKFLLKSTTTHRFLVVITTLYGFWNLDFFRYILPPLCLSPKLKLIHITFLYYTSAFYPLFLISITWICIQLHSHNVKPIVWFWSKLNWCCFKLTKVHLDCSNSLTNAFATFFLLSYAKVVFISSRMLDASKVMHLKNYSVHTFLTAKDPSLGYFSTKHLPYIAASIIIFLLAILPLSVLLMLYPVKCFRSLLFKIMSTRTTASLNIFVERYYSCYRDGTDGGKDMRSMVSMYFLLRLLISILYSETIFEFSTISVFVATLYGGCSLMIALVRPYKKSYMSTVDALILGNMALITLMLDHRYDIKMMPKHLPVYLLILNIFISLPLLSLIGFICYKILQRLPVKKWQRRLRWLNKVSIKFCNGAEAVNKELIPSSNLESTSSNNLELPDRMCYPRQYDLEKDAHTQYVQYEDKTPDRFELYLSQ